MHLKLELEFSMTIMIWDCEWLSFEYEEKRIKFWDKMVKSWQYAIAVNVMLISRKKNTFERNDETVVETA